MVAERRREAVVQQKLADSAAEAHAVLKTLGEVIKTEFDTTSLHLPSNVGAISHKQTVMAAAVPSDSFKLNHNAWLHAGYQVCGGRTGSLSKCDTEQV